MSRSEDVYKNLMISIDREMELSSEGEGCSKEIIFTNYFLEQLSNGENPAVRGYNPEVFRYENLSSKAKINAFYIDDSEQEITVYVTYFESSSEMKNVLQPTVEDTLKKLNNFMQMILKEPDKLLDSMEEDYPAYELVYNLVHHHKDYLSFNYVLLTNGIVREMKMPSFRFNNKKVEVSVFDLERFRRYVDGLKVIEIDATLDILGEPIPCLYKTTEGGDYDTYCSILPGNVIYNLFDAYHYQLLNSNVRTYLQLRGGVNQGIMNTIQNEPTSFLAYNNGLSVTASNIDLDDDGNIICVKDFQIVNGGQTSASIYNAKAVKGFNIDDVNVFAKITVIRNEEKRSEIVKNISRYANTQNAIKDSDLSTNEDYIKELAKLSRNIYTPVIGNKLQTKWFFENVAGSYNIEKSLEGRRFEKEYPKDQYFKKTDMGTYELVFEGHAHLACKGAQDAYKIFVMNLSHLGVPTESDYKHLIAKKILFDHTIKILKESYRQGCRAMACYVVAYMSTVICDRKLNLDEIWNAQSVSPELDKDLRNLADQMCPYIVEKAFENQLSNEMYCRRKNNWEDILTHHYTTSHTPLYTGEHVYKPTLSTKRLSAELASLIINIDQKVWLELIGHVDEISRGDKKTSRIFSNSCTTYANGLKDQLTERQLAFALKIIYKFYSNGYNFEDNLKQQIENHMKEIQESVKTSQSKFSNEPYFEK